eukprot:7806733-Alexandrium_andersonii.AAC.1
MVRSRPVRVAIRLNPRSRLPRHRFRRSELDQRRPRGALNIGRRSSRGVCAARICQRVWGLA